MDDRKSTGGYVYTVAGDAISWKLKTHTTVALSSTKVGCVVAALAAKRRHMDKINARGISPTLASVLR